MIERIDTLKDEVLKYKKIKKEYNDILYLWKDVTKYLEQLRDRYRFNPSYELKKEINEYELQERDYYELFNEYQIELTKFDSNMDEKAEFYDIYCTFIDLSNSIKDLENKSKKFGTKKMIGTNRVETYNAEGRKKYIHEYLLQDYNELVYEKKKLLPRYRELYDKFIDVKVVNDEVSNEIVIDDIKISEQEIVEIEQEIWNNMTIDDKINYFLDRVNRIINAKNTGKKDRILVYGKYYYVPEKNKNDVIRYLTEIKKLNELKNINSIKESNKPVDKDENLEEIVSYINNKGDNNVIALPTTILELTEVDKDTDKDENLEEIVSYIDKKHDNNVIELPATVSELTEAEKKSVNYNNSNKVYEIKDGVIEIELPEMEVIDLKSMEESGLEFVRDDNDNSIDIWSDSKKQEEFLNNNSSSDEDTIKNDTKSNNKLMVLNVEKPKKKFNLKKKIIAAAAVVAVALTTAFSAFGISGLSKKNEDNKMNSDEKMSYDDIMPQFPIDNLHDSIMNNVTNKPNDLSNNNEKSNSEVQFENARDIGDNVIINNIESVRIYKDVYSAMNEENGYYPYFDCNKNRVVKGYLISSNDSYSYYEEQKKVDELLNNGGKIESVVVGDEYGYEGAYNVNDVIFKVKKK